MRQYDKNLAESKTLLHDLKEGIKKLYDIKEIHENIFSESGTNQQIESALLNAENLIIEAESAKKKFDDITSQFLTAPSDESDSVLAELTHLSAKIRTAHAETETLKQNSENNYSNIKEYHTALLVDTETKTSLKNEIENFTQLIKNNSEISEQKKDEIVTFHDSLFLGDDEQDEESIENEINNFVEEIFAEEGIQKKSQNFLDKIDKLNVEYQEHHVNLNGEEEKKNEEGKLIVAKKIGYKEDTKQALEYLKTARDTFTSDLKILKETNTSDLKILKETNEQERQSIVTRIKELLPNAMGAGLASTYREAKVNHSYALHDNIWLSIDEQMYKSLDVRRKEKEARKSKSIWGKAERGMENIVGIFFKITSFCVSKLLWHHIIFLAPLGIILYMNFYEFFSESPIDINAIRERFKSMDINHVVIASLSMLPLAIISFFGFANIRRNNKLYDEYSYKEYVVRMYVGFKDELEDNAAKEILNKITMEAVATRPSSIKNEETPLEGIMRKFCSSARIDKNQDLTNKNKTTINDAK